MESYTRGKQATNESMAVRSRRLAIMMQCTREIIDTKQLETQSSKYQYVSVQEHK